MSTEEDTFNKLRRVPFLKVMVEIALISVGRAMKIKTETREEVFKRTGWTEEEYNLEFEKLTSNTEQISEDYK